MKSLTYLLTASALLTPPAIAQERAATGPMDTQMTWSALSDQISSLKTQVTGTNARMDQLVLCGKKGLLYAPGQAGADGQGCLAAAVKPPASGPLPYKLETMTFNERAIPFRSTPSAYCISKGFDVLSGATTQTSTHRTGGSTGEVDTTTSTTYSCMRVITR
ncbi:Uncharacterized protein MLTONO_p0550 (plasmid) [Mesorhizobium loti]|nr:Uncharacterized protein MLTONO_p0550 [Mesorhizobium loti]